MYNNIKMLNKMISLSYTVTVVITAVTLISFFQTCKADCYFSSELQGIFLTQSTITDNEVNYSQVNITENAIPIWGQCHRRIDNNVILMIKSDETACFRCFHLKLVAKNVLRVHTVDKDYISKCYTNEEKAIASCPRNELLLGEGGRNTEIILYKTVDYDQQTIRREYCPINGKYKFTYNVDDGLEDKIECSHPDSELDNCPSGSAINLRFRNCSFENHEINFECLGHWRGFDNRTYLALMNSRTDLRSGPQYRCAIYEEHPISGVITITFSNDSTCTSAISSTFRQQTRLQHHQHIHSETLTLHPVPETQWPHNNIMCKFPEWMSGSWQHMSVDVSTILFKDHNTFKTYTMKCIDQRMDMKDKYIVFSRSQCGEEMYQCVWTIERSANILEFQVGSERSSNINDINRLCDPSNFDDNRWLTQGRLDHSLVLSPCPVKGEFTGYMPDAERLCAQLSSECKSPDIMHYQVSDCEMGEVFEEREYRCLGQWHEGNVVYTYTKRRDYESYECFVGTILSESQVYIKEAGEHCQRHVNPSKYGMELKKIAGCKDPPSTTTESGVYRMPSDLTELITGWNGGTESSRPTYRLNNTSNNSERDDSDIRTNEITNSKTPESKGGGHGGSNEGKSSSTRLKVLNFLSIDAVLASFVLYLCYF